MTTTEDQERDEADCCTSCIGTGIGNPHVQGSACWACNGSGRARQERRVPDIEEPWAWNHFEADMGDDEEGF